MLENALSFTVNHNLSWCYLQSFLNFAKSGVFEQFTCQKYVFSLVTMNGVTFLYLVTEVKKTLLVKLFTFSGKVLL